MASKFKVSDYSKKTERILTQYTTILNTEWNTGDYRN